MQRSSSECAVLTDAARAQHRQTAVFWSDVTKPICLTRARAVRALGRAPARQRLCSEQEDLGAIEGSQTCYAGSMRHGMHRVMPMCRCKCTHCCLPSANFGPDPHSRRLEAVGDHSSHHPQRPRLLCSPSAGLGQSPYSQRLEPLCPLPGRVGGPHPGAMQSH